MLHVNDDMDGLFRKAAENYPLNTSSSDWDEVRGRMNAVKEPARKVWPLRFLIIALLFTAIPLKLLYNGIAYPHQNAVAIQPSIEEIINTEGQEKKSGFQPVEKELSIPTTSTPSGTVRNLKVAASRSGKNINGNHRSNTISGQTKIKQNINEPDENSVVYTMQELSLTDAAKANTVINPAIPVEDNIPEAETTSFTSILIPEADPAQLIAKEVIPDKDEVNVKQEDKSKTKKKPVRLFYAGIIAGPDVTSVKMQSVKKVGLGYGIITGFRFNDRFAVEAGLLADKKYYNTDGKYFSTKNIPIPNYVSIDHAEGDCNMLEIPVNFRYDFKKKNGSGWFASAGVTSYLMKKEYYDYEMTRYGVVSYRSFTYNESRNSFASVLNLGGGYSLKLGKVGDLRIEPYIKIPLNKVGIGNLPLQSAGMYIGFTRTIFQINKNPVKK